MSNLPNFKAPGDEEAYINIFETKLQKQWALMTRVRNRFFGNDSYEYKWEGLDAKTIELIRDITSDLMYKADTDFKDRFPEYKTSDDDIFIPYKSFKENVAEAISEALDKREQPWYHPESSLNKIDLGGK